MRALIFTVMIVVSSISSASAQCYGEAANAFGCGIKRAPEGSLSAFGDSRDEVLPEYGTTRAITVDDLFTTQEEIGWYRQIILNQRNGIGSQGALNNAIVSGARPLRPSRNFPAARLRY